MKKASFPSVINIILGCIILLSALWEIGSLINGLLKHSDWEKLPHFVGPLSWVMEIVPHWAWFIISGLLGAGLLVGGIGLILKVRRWMALGLVAISVKILILLYMNMLFFFIMRGSMMPDYSDPSFEFLQNVPAEVMPKIGLLVFIATSIELFLFIFIFYWIWRELKKLATNGACGAVGT